MRPDERGTTVAVAGRLLPDWLLSAARLALLAGGVTCIVGLTSPSYRQAAWASLLVNHLYWLGLAQGAVGLAAMLRLANARWRGPVVAVAQAAVAYLPLSFIPWVMIYLGRKWIFPWIGADMGDRGVWLNIPGLFARDGAGMAVLTVLSLAYVRAEMSHDRPASAGDRPGARTGVLSGVLLSLFLLVFTVLALDLVMSLEPSWQSSLLGAYFSAGAMYTGIAAVILLEAVMAGRGEPQRRFSPQTRLDVANLMVSFCMLTAYMFFAQVLVIWYGNLPEETSFLAARWHQAAWHGLAWTVVVVALLGPFCVMLVRAAKQSPPVLAAVAGAALVGMWLERYLLIAPSLRPQGAGPTGLDLGIWAAFAGAFVLAVDWFCRRYARALVSDLGAATTAEAGGEVGG